MPLVIKPMLATLVDDPFSDPDWLFETKWDGVRAVCFLDNGAARFISRNQNELTEQYPELANIGKSISGVRAILDGEIVALDEHGVSRFQLLQTGWSFVRMCCGRGVKRRRRAPVRDRESP